MMFKHGMTIGPNGSVRPCCMYMNDDIQQRYNDDGWREVFDELYEKSLDQWLPNCYECKAEEDRGNKSLRQDANEWFADTHGIQYWDLKLHNTCNLTCVMCNPTSSSKWNTLVNENPNEDWSKIVRKESKLEYGWHKDILPKILHNLYDTKYIKFTGGEPLLIPHVRKIIKQLVEEDVAPSVRLSMITNGTIALDEEMQQLLKHFKHVVWIVSIDGIEDRYEYIRHGANWSEVETNVKQFAKIQELRDNFTVSINYLPMCINAAYDAKTEEWARGLGLHFSRSVEIYRPKYLTYASLSYKLRDKYNISTDYEYSDESFQELLKNMEIKDRLLGTDFKSACPEFFE